MTLGEITGEILKFMTSSGDSSTIEMTFDYTCDMQVPNSYHFKHAKICDIMMLNGWLMRAHVSEWWDVSSPFDEEKILAPNVNRWIVSHDAKPMAFMQDYDVTIGCSDGEDRACDEVPFRGLPKGARGIDQFIADVMMTGQGHGSALIKQRMQELFASGVPIIATDPHPDNARAIHIYKKLGFKAISKPQITAWGLVLPMVACSI